MLDISEPLNAARTALAANDRSHMPALRGVLVRALTERLEPDQHRQVVALAADLERAWQQDDDVGHWPGACAGSL